MALWRAMKPSLDLATLVPCTEFVAEDAEETALGAEMFYRARTYVQSFDWCDEVRECYVGDIAVPGVIAVLLFRIASSHDAVDEWLWVVTGDLPPAYLVTDDAPTPAAALAVTSARWNVGSPPPGQASPSTT
jgi:hypothetical protein